MVNDSGQTGSSPNESGLQQRGVDDAALTAAASGPGPTAEVHAGLKIAFLCDFSPLNRNMYSGGNARMYDALVSQGHEVTILSQSWGLAEPLRWLMHKTPDAINLRARWRLHLALAPIIARGVRAELARGSYDVLFCTYSFHSLSRLRTPYPMVTAYSSDATPTTYRTSDIGAKYESVIPGGRMLDSWIERCERRVFQQTDLLFWPSNWLRKKCNALYDLDPKTSVRIAWGANIEKPPKAPPREIVRGAPLNLLLVGRDWFAKGGPIAFDTAKILRERGLDARLTVIGCQPPDFHMADWVTVHQQLDKSIPEQEQTFNEAYAKAHFLVQPSYESYGFAFCEASAHGLPSLCLRVGGVPVINRVNGYALPKESGPEVFADLLCKLQRDPEGYAKLCRSSRRKYVKRLNWTSWAKDVTAHLRDAVATLPR